MPVLFANGKLSGRPGKRSGRSLRILLTPDHLATIPWTNLDAQGTSYTLLWNNVDPRLFRPRRLRVAHDAVLDRTHLDARLASGAVILIDQSERLWFSCRGCRWCRGLRHNVPYAISTIISSRPLPAGTIGNTFSSGSMYTSKTTVRFFTSFSASSKAPVTWLLAVTRIPRAPCASASLTKSGR